MVEASPPDVVLLDIGLPGMDGYQIAERLRERWGAGTMKIVALTGYGGAEDRQRSLRAGFDHHLVKPVSLEELQEVLSDRPQGRS
jgi:CheY-like chemotaxis protein